MRQYVDEEIQPYAFDWEQAGQVPEKARISSTHEIHLLIGIQAFKRHAELGYLAVGLGLDVPLPGGIPLKEWDHFHSLVLSDELCRVVSFSNRTK